MIRLAGRCFFCGRRHPKEMTDCPVLAEIIEEARAIRDAS